MIKVRIKWPLTRRQKSIHTKGRNPRYVQPLWQITGQWQTDRQHVERTDRQKSLAR